MIWSNLFQGTSHKPGSNRVRPQLEILEDRQAPSDMGLASSAGLVEPEQAAAALLGGQSAAQPVRLDATLTGQAISAVPTPDPNVLLVTTVGSGQAAGLGSFSYISPHLTNVVTLKVEGPLTLTFSDGTITGKFSGQLHVDPETGHVVGRHSVIITGGTGRFEGATGAYIFEVDFNPATLQSTATIHGLVVTPPGQDT